MDTNKNLIKGIVVIGTVLVWLPLLLPLFFGLASLVVTGKFRLDYLMPMELFLLVLVGGLLLVWAAWNERAHLTLVGWSLGTAVVMLFGSQGTAVITGLASGATPVGGWQWLLVMTMLVIYILAVAGLGLGGLWLIRDLFWPAKPKLEI